MIRRSFAYHAHSVAEDPPPSPEPIRFESFGVRIDIRLDGHDATDAILALLPPGARRTGDRSPDIELFLTREGDLYRVGADSVAVAPAVDLDVALEMLELQIRASVAVHARDRIFIHAGVVEHRGRAIVVPGASFSGKTTLVTELLRAGACYCSDEFAVLDDEGWVHPYPKPLSIRYDEDRSRGEIPASAIGATTTEDRVPVGLVVVTSYRPGAAWDPKPISPGATALELVAHAVPARERPEQVLRAVRQAAAQSSCLRGERGEARDVVPYLLAMLDAP